MDRLRLSPPPSFPRLASRRRTLTTSVETLHARFLHQGYRMMSTWAAPAGACSLSLDLSPSGPDDTLSTSRLIETIGRACTDPAFPALTHTVHRTAALDEVRRITAVSTLQVITRRWGGTRNGVLAELPYSSELGRVTDCNMTPMFYASRTAGEGFVSARTRRNGSPRADQESPRFEHILPATSE